MLLPVFLFLALFLSAKQATSDVGPADNGAVFRQLCKLVALAEKSPALGPHATLNTAAVTEMEELNISLSPATWQAKFAKAEVTDTLEEMKTKANVTDDNIAKDWHNKWRQWVLAYKATRPDTAAATRIKEAGFNNLTPGRRWAAQMRVQAHLARAQALLTEGKQYSAAAAKPTAADYPKKLKDAVLGDDVGNKASVTIAKTFSGGANSGRSNACGGNIANHPATTAAATLMCVCAEAAANQPGGACISGQTVTTTWTTAAPPALGVWTQLAGECPDDDGAVISADALLTPIRELNSMVVKLNNAGFLGKTVTKSNCDGSSDAGVCVKYSDFTGKGDKKFTDIPWVVKLVNLAQDLQLREAAAAAIKNINHQLKAEREAAYACATALTEPPTTVETKSLSSKTKEDKEGCKQQKSNKTACTEANCKWQGKTETDGPCKPKDGEGQTNAAAGTGTGTAGDQKKERAASAWCAKHGTDETACENDKTGDKQNCAFRKGKESEDEPEKEKHSLCSFIVNNKLALIAAAFFSLEAFQNCKDF
ncbi:variant surface glycoprotein (VSG, atypical), putative [Trypanosoma brucei brucei TREU927]|uniref:Variant surface glycoprotein (VSG, atypical), putative n=1 Tax=Trypanosoma brucei brucei (strain 927/4 GUTat10.1) TaxID=185431 RepID=Q4GY50_TRYB2|nr:variant surface glycoprotein (VSG, atypical), putative [Trypanosoma brucei brucei TREU927]CAJ16740.1 variant surface glycoprotein (VSG, atypical), putative [Trypanosoma brucei brucei TREU927]